MRYFLDPFGCAKNQVDAELIMARFNEAGWTEADDPAGADLIIVNSCGFIEAAKRESINAVLAWKKQFPEKKILLSGCLVARYRAELEESLVEADRFSGCAEPGRALEIAAALFARTKPPPTLPLPDVLTPQTEFAPSVSSPPTQLEQSASPPAQPCKTGLRPLLGFPGSAYVKIAEGCNNRCSFCAIPLIRGPLRCRSIPGIVEECKQLLERGVKELCLIGQDIASYEPSLSALLEAIAALPGAFWVRLLYLHPDHFPQDILPLLEADSRFLPYFDIPLQHASPRLLSLMGRRGSGETYLRLLDTIRSRLPDAVIRSTFLTGFPGETEEDFELLLHFQKQASLDWLGVFCYSREEGTAACSMHGRVAKRIALRRKSLIEKTQIPITEERMNRFVGRTLNVLVEEELGGEQHLSGQAENSLWLGRLFCQAPEVDGAAVISQSYNVWPEKAASLPVGRPTQSIQVTAQPIPAARPVPGDMIRGTVFARAGFDLEVRIP
ncbi:MAG: 30S ribosomal protein S12 methylthiotransferase RimO [Spirochaetaceae bacterium]|jgi:ribosomal protein S12 methylthiotransferase|nr:30S ribosomal protein S12 methylthiotransferase RimO [Spirochaetaceae bacterium]